MYDAKRGDYQVLYANENYQEGNNGAGVNFTAAPNGFIVTGTGQNHNGAGQTYVYVAISEPPTTRSLTDEELAKQKLLFGTYDNRAAVKAGEEAMEDRADLAAKLKESGYTDDLVKEVLGDVVKKKSRKKS